ncbi:MAG TPA: PBP1A family penicillin-binding protein, partial [Bdellovibrionota bacterium]|nr:PBP1A family penicillin-binding protein [Bdellovibrionota bacterium]
MNMTTQEKPRGFFRKLFSPTALLLYLLLVMVSVGALAIYVTRATRLIEKKFSGQLWAIPSKVYSDTYRLYPGINALDRKIEDKLRRLGYTPTYDQIKNNGEYRIARSPKGEITNIEIYLHAFDYPNQSFSGYPLQINLQNGVVESMKNVRTGEEVSIVELEPELITEFFEGTREVRQIIKLKDVPPNLLNSIIAIEDQRFLEHGGIDPKGIFRAFMANIFAGGKVVQGGSTLTQQLVKNFFLTPERSIKRKVIEAVMALIVEMKYSKDQILELYVNEIYLGQRGSAEIHGVAEATQFYFSKPLRELTLSEAALLAGLIRGPNYYEPFQHYDRATSRKDKVLDHMLQANLIVREEYDDARRDRPQVRQTFIMNNSAPYFVDYLRHQLLELYDTKILASEGLRIFTTLDTIMQQEADKAVAEGVVDLEKTYRHVRTPPTGGFPHWKGPVPQRWISSDNILQAALIAIEPPTGHIKSMVGGRGYAETQLNRAFQSKRQPGSTFKPFTYITALMDPQHRWSLSSTMPDEPFTHVFAGGQTWSPRNYGEKYRGSVSLHYALRHSINVPTARLALQVGVPKIIETAKKMGITTALKPFPSVVLGSQELTPIELATAYSTLANNGIYVTPIAIKQIVDKNNRVVEQRNVKAKEGIPPDVAYMITYVLQDVVKQGTAVRVRQLGFNRPVAGKT